MSLAEVLAPVNARPPVPSAIVISAPLAPAGTQGEGRVKVEVADVEVAADEVVADAIRALSSALSDVKAEGRAKRVRADDPPHIDILSPLQAMLPLGDVFERALKCSKTSPQ